MNKIRVLVVCSGNIAGFDMRLHQPFIIEQIEAINHLYQVEYDFYIIKGKGVKGYLSNYWRLVEKTKSGKYNLIHAHYGLSGLLAVMQRKIPVVITFHGSDFNTKKIRAFSLIARSLASASIFVTKRMMISIKKNNSDFIIPCGVNLDVFFPVDKKKSREILGLDYERPYALFASSFDNSVKNYPLAKSSIEQLDSMLELIELKNKTRTEVNFLLNAVDLLLLTSTSEGSPQIIKEAMACNCPIVATDVGDIKEIILDTKFCFVTDHSVKTIAEKIKLILEMRKKSNGRKMINPFDNLFIAKEIYEVYTKVIKNDM